MSRRKIILFPVALIVSLVVGYLAICTVRTYRANVIYARIAGSEWLGRWDSEGLGDGGELRLRLERRDDGAFRTVWMAQHYGVFKSAYDEIMTADVAADGLIILDGSIKLGVEGTYHYRGTIEGDRLRMTWKSATDHGVLDLRRVEAGAGDGK